MADMNGYTPGRYVLAHTDAEGARDGAGLLQQVRLMRVGFEEIALKPALIVIVVHEPEAEGAVERIEMALNKGFEG